MTTEVIGSPTARVTVDTALGGRVVSLVVNGTEMTCGPADGPDTFGFGIYPMVPFAGRVRDARVSHGGVTALLPADAGPHALHGTLHSVPWAVDSRDDTGITMSAVLAEPWPWRAGVTHTVSVTGSTLRMELSLTARDSQPAMLGWHPWFARPCSVSLDFGAMYERATDHLPTGRLVPPRTEGVDDCFVDPLEDPTVTVRDTRLTLRSDCSHWVVFDGAAHGICVEPQTGAPNSVNDSPVVVPAGGVMRHWFEIRW